MDGKTFLQIPYDSKSYISVSLARNDTAQESPTEVNISVLSDENLYLTPNQNILLLWHQKFGHRNMQSIQHVFFHVHTFASPKFTGVVKCEMPKCETCEYMKALRHPTRGFAFISKPDTNGAIKASYNRHGAHVSVNHFEYCLKGRTLTSFGRSSSEK